VNRQLGTTTADVMIILKWILWKLDMKVKTALNWLRRMPNSGFWGLGIEPS
jgi:hypothetical protein